MSLINRGKLCVNREKSAPKIHHFSPLVFHRLRLLDSGKKKEHKHKLFGRDFLQTFLTLTPECPGVKKFLPATGTAGKRTFWCGRPRFSARTSMTRRVFEKLCTKKFALIFWPLKKFAAIFKGKFLTRANVLRIIFMFLEDLGRLYRRGVATQVILTILLTLTTHTPLIKGVTSVYKSVSHSNSLHLRHLRTVECGGLLECCRKFLVLVGTLIFLSLVFR